MADQAENLRRLVRARRDWEELAGGPPARRAAGADGAGPREPSREAGSIPGLGAGRKAGRAAR